MCFTRFLGMFAVTVVCLRFYGQSDLHWFVCLLTFVDLFCLICFKRMDLCFFLYAGECRVFLAALPPPLFRMLPFYTLLCQHVVYESLWFLIS